MLTSSALILYVSIHPIVGAIEELFYHFDFDGLDDFSTLEPGDYSLETNLTSQYCPSDTTCWRMYCATEVETTLSFTGYHTLRMFIDVTPKALDDAPEDGCFIELLDPEFIVLLATHNDSSLVPKLDNSITLSSEYDNASSITFYLGAAGGADPDCSCYWDNLKFFGIPYVTELAASPVDNETDVYLNCTQPNECPLIDCPTDADCNIRCVSDQTSLLSIPVCSGTINCPNNGDCNVFCSGLCPPIASCTYTYLRTIVHRLPRCYNQLSIEWLVWHYVSGKYCMPKRNH